MTLEPSPLDATPQARDGDPRKKLNRFAVLRRAFLAMADHRLGHDSEARTRMERLDEALRKDDGARVSEQTREVLVEAHATLGLAQSPVGADGP